MTQQGNGAQPPARRKSPPAPSRLLERALLPARAARNEVREGWALFLRRKWLISLCLLSGLFVGAVSLRVRTPLFQASTMLKYEPPERVVVQMLEADGDVWGSTVEELQTQVGLLKSDRVAGRVLDRLVAEGEVAKQPSAPSLLGRAFARVGRAKSDIRSWLLAAPPADVDPEIAARARSIDRMQERLTVEHVRNTKLIKLTYRDVDPRRAARIADGFCEEYIGLLREEKRAYVDQAVRWIDSQAVEAQTRLKLAESKLLRYRESIDSVALEDNLASSRKNLIGVHDDIQALRQEVALAEAAQQGAEQSEIKQILLSRSPEYAALSRKLVDLEIRRVPLAARNRPAFPELAQLDVEIDAVKKQLDREAVQIVRRIQGDSMLAALEIERLTPALKAEESRIEHLNGQMTQLMAIQREIDSSAEFYRLMLDRSQEFGATSAIEAINAAVVGPAPIPLMATYPGIGKTLVVALGLGFILACASVYLLENSDRSIRDTQEIQTVTGLDTLALIPYLGAGRALIRARDSRRAADATSPLLYLNQEPRPRSISGEIFRYLRTALQYGGPNGSPCVIQITSALPSEGKSTVASNLALVFAARGEKTLLVDGDLHRRSLHKVFGVSESPGFSDVLLGASTLESALRPTRIPHLDILTSGRPVVCPVDLFVGPGGEELFKQLRRRYSAVIVDSAPVLGVADCLVLARMADGACLVVDRDKTDVEALREAVDVLERVKANLLGAIVNTRDRNSRYSRDYDYGYANGNAEVSVAQGPAPRSTNGLDAKGLDRPAPIEFEL